MYRISVLSLLKFCETSNKLSEIAHLEGKDLIVGDLKKNFESGLEKNKKKKFSN